MTFSCEGFMAAICTCAVAASSRFWSSAEARTTTEERRARAREGGGERGGGEGDDRGGHRARSGCPERVVPVRSSPTEFRATAHASRRTSYRRRGMNAPQSRTLPPSFLA